MNNPAWRSLAVLLALANAASLAACGSGGPSAPVPASEVTTTPAPTPSTPDPTPPLASAISVSLTTELAAYRPGAPVHVKLGLNNGAASAVSGAKAVLQARHLGEAVGAPLEQAIALPAGASSAELSWQPPAADFQGYALDVSIVDASGKVLASETGAVDVSSSWLKFPRYGYVSGYPLGLDAQGIVSQLNAYHINALQFYDWQWKHHLPLKGTPTNVDATWPDIANRTTSRDTIRNLITAAHSANMATMQYNLIYGAAMNYQADGVSPSWGLFDTKGGKQWQYNLPASWATQYLYFFNPIDTGWQNYLLDRQIEVFQAFDFDGWHADTVGDNGIKYDATGNAVDIKDTFLPFLNAAKQRLGSKLLMMNAVGNKGGTQVNASKVDAVYVEVWPWDQPDYGSIKALVDQSRGESGGKSLIVPAYMNYDYAKTRSNESPGNFNEPGVLLMEATVLAAGGSRLELGDDTRMLCNEYFPNRSLVMGSALKTSLRYYYDFAVAYQNLLRDGQTAVQKSIAIDGATVSANGAGDSVWAYAKQDTQYETVNLINLRGLTDTSWRDTNATQKKPTAMRSFKLKYYTGAKYSQAWAASPDAEGGRSKALPLEYGSDASGSYVAVTVPSLDYWTLLYFKKSN